MTVSEFQARRIERIAEAMAHFVATTPEEKLAWRPICNTEAAHTRSVLEQIVECVAVNTYLAGLLNGEDSGKPVLDDPALLPADSKSAQEQIVASGRVLAGAIRRWDDTVLEHAFPNWRGPLRGETLLESAYRNMAYHCGQINFIQILAGDTEFHMPPTWL